MYLLLMTGQTRLNVDENEAKAEGEDTVGRGYLLDSDDLNDAEPPRDHLDIDGKDDDGDDVPLYVRDDASNGGLWPLYARVDDVEITPPDDRDDKTPHRERPMMEMLGLGNGNLAPVHGNSVLESYRQREPQRGCEEILPYRV